MNGRVRGTLLVVAGLVGCKDATLKDSTAEVDLSGFQGPCPEGPEDSEVAGSATSEEVFDNSEEAPQASVLVTCTDAECTELVFDGSTSLGTDIEWLGSDNEGLSEDTQLVVARPDAGAATSPITLAVRDASAPQTCDGVRVTAAVVETTLNGGAAPRVIVTPLWIASTGVKASGCNFVAGIGGCITDAALDGLRAAGTSRVTTTGVQADLAPYEINLAAGTATAGFTAWSAWDYLQSDGNMRRGSMGTLPKPLFSAGIPTGQVNLGGVVYTDYALFGYSLNKNYTVNLTETKVDNTGIVYDTATIESTCSSTSRGSSTIGFGG